MFFFFSPDTVIIHPKLNMEWIKIRQALLLCHPNARARLYSGIQLRTYIDIWIVALIKGNLFGLNNKL